MSVGHLDPAIVKQNGLTILRRLTAILITAAVPLSACGDKATEITQNQNTAEAAIGAANALLDTLKEGQSQLSFSGTVNSTGDSVSGKPYHSEGRFQDNFRPASSMSKQAQARRGSNAEGPYEFSVYSDVVYQDATEETVPAWVVIRLPENANPGTYRVTALLDSTDNDAQASVAGDGYAWRFNRDISGTLDIIEVGDRLTAAWDFEAHGRSDTSVHVSGAVKALAFTPQPEATFTLKSGDEVINHFGRPTSQWKSSKHTILLGSGVYLALPSDALEGTYAIQKSREYDTVAVTLASYSFDDVIGEITLENDGNYMNGSYSLKATGQDTVEIDGTFTHVKLKES